MASPSRSHHLSDTTAEAAHTASASTPSSIPGRTHHQQTLSRTPSFLPALPVEIIVTIASSLDMWDMISAKQACSAWYHVIEDTPSLWQNPCFKLVTNGISTYLPPPDYVKKRLKGNPVRTLHFTAVHGAFNSDAAPTFWLVQEYSPAPPELSQVTDDLLSTLLPTEQVIVAELIVTDFSYSSLKEVLKALAGRIAVCRLIVVAPSIQTPFHRLFPLLRRYAESNFYQDITFNAGTAFIRQPSKGMDLSTHHACNGGGRKQHVNFGANLFGSRPYRLPVMSSDQADFCAVGGNWVLPFDDSGDPPQRTLRTTRICLRDIWHFGMHEYTLPFPLLRIFCVTFARSHFAGDGFHQMYPIVAYLKAANLEILNLCLSSLARLMQPERQFLARQWRLLVERTPKLRALKLHSHLPDSLDILGEDPYVSQGLTKLILSGDNLPSTFLNTIVPENMPALRFLDVSGTAYHASHELARQTEWEAAWRDAKIDCFEPPRMPAFEL